MNAWLASAQRRHTRLASAIVSLACLAALSPPDLPAQAAVLLAGVVLVGMPHGAFDHIVAARVLRPRLGTMWWAAFLAFYLALAGLVVLGWMAAPAVTLAAFLELSVLHFGLGDAEQGAPRIPVVLARGALPILLPIALHRAEVAPLLAALADKETGAMAATLADARWLLLPWGAVFLTWLWSEAARGERAEALALCAAFALLPPLLAFALYFCLCHSVRHLLQLGATLAPDSARDACRALLRVAGPAALLCAVGAVFLVADGTEAALTPLFRLLAALTLPHMVVTLGLERRAALAHGDGRMAWPDGPGYAAPCRSNTTPLAAAARPKRATVSRTGPLTRPDGAGGAT